MRNGYDPEEVDEFFDHARQVYEGKKPERLTSTDIQVSMFDLIRGGYDTHEVDAALDRLEGPSSPASAPSTWRSTVSRPG
ncbi:DivIVA domain-containing protein [Oerskovia sp. M15]